jgi:hypothetical protein
MKSQQKDINIFSFGSKLQLTVPKTVYRPQNDSSVYIEINEPTCVGKSNNRHLECIAVNTTSIEVFNGRFLKFINEIKKSSSSEITRSIVLYIFLNNASAIRDVESGIDGIRDIFKFVKVVSLDLDEIDDMYNTKPSSTDHGGKYGFLSGPYCLFKKTMQNCIEYNTTILLETDCVLSTDWIEKLYNYTRHAGGFWISGATYDGTFFNLWNDRILFNHLNGVGLYATGNKDFQYFLKLFDIFYIYNVHCKVDRIGYDHCMRGMIDYFLQTRPMVYYWRVVDRNMIRNQYIINCSPVGDADMASYIDKIYDYAILHIKSI